jgi:hypothetical protein
MYTTRQEADKAIEIFHNKRTLQPVKLPPVLPSSLVFEFWLAFKEVFPRLVSARCSGLNSHVLSVVV